MLHRYAGKYVFSRQIAIGRETRQIDPRRGQGKQRAQCRRVVAELHRLEPGEPLRLRASARWRKNIDYRAAAERAAGRLVAHDEAVAVQRADRLLENELHASRFAGRDGSAFEQRDAAEHVRRAEVHVHRGPMGERLRTHRAQTGIDAARGRRQLALHDPVAARDRFPAFDPGQVERQALSGAAALRRRVLRVD